MYREGGQGMGPTVNLAEGDKNWQITQQYMTQTSHTNLTSGKLQDDLE